AFDLDSDGILDYLEWIVPHLSNQTFEIILITKAEHLDSNRTFVEDVYAEVSVRDGVFMTIPALDYLRVSFEQNLTLINDITIYARSSENASVEVYEKDGTELIAGFGIISEDKKYQIYLTNLTGEPQDTFDLKIVEGNVDFDFVIDPFESATCDEGDLDTTCTLNHTYTFTDGEWINANNLIIGSNGSIFNNSFTSNHGLSVVINVSGNLTIQSGGNITGGNISIYAENFVAEDNSTVTSEGLGWEGSYGPGGSGSSAASYGGIGGNGNRNVYGSIIAPTDLGSGGRFRSGGGAVTFNVTEITSINGTVTVEGTTGSQGGGSGGSIFVTTGNLTGNGTIQANGGGSTSYTAGGGGRVAVILTNATDFSGFTGNITAYGSDEGDNSAAGTIYEETANQASGAGTLIIDNNDLSIVENLQIYTLMPSENVSKFSNITIRNMGYLSVDGNDTLDFTNLNISGEGVDESFIVIENSTGVNFPSQFNISGYTLFVDGLKGVTSNWTVKSDGAISHSDNTVAETYKINLTIDGDLTIEAGGVIDVDGKGYKDDVGPGSDSVLYNGGGYGGIGGDDSCDSVIASTTYGSITVPINQGSGGARGKGGGIVILNVTGATIVNGNISSGAISNSGSGSGGSIYLITKNLTGNGVISAKGGPSTSFGAGGGGRVAVYLTQTGAVFSSYDGTIVAYGGDATTENNDGAAGTVYLEESDDTYGELIIDNLGRSTCSYVTTLIRENVTGTTVGNVTIRNSGILEVNTSLTVYGDWNNTGTFDENVSTINFVGTDNSTIHNNETFYSLNITKKGGYVFFPVGGVTNVTNLFDVQGNSSDYSYLRSTTDGVQWYLNYSGSSYSVNFADIMDSNNTGTTISSYTSIDSGNNTGWEIYSGFCDSFEGTVCILNHTYQYTDGQEIVLEGLIIGSNGSIINDTMLSSNHGASLTITVSGNLTIQNGANVTGGNVTISAGNFSLENGSLINSEGLGWKAGNGPGYPGCYGGLAPAGGTTYGSITAPTDIGSASGGSNNGGGAIILNVTGEFNFNGSLNSNGIYVNGGGGSGGSIYITTRNITGNGTITANGGGTGSGSSSAGGGGRVSIILTNATDFVSFTGTITAFGGNTASDAAAGTIYKETASQAPETGTLIIDNNDRTMVLGVYTLMVNETVHQFSNITILNNGYLAVDGNDTLNFTNLNITGEGPDDSFIVIMNSTGVSFPGEFNISGYTLILDDYISTTGNWIIKSDGGITHSDNSNAETYKINLTIDGNLTIEPGGTIDVDGKGYDSGQGPGTPGGSSNGASYGGVGGDYACNGDSSRKTYGSITVPTKLGSGSGGIGVGGGAIKLNVTGITNVSGTISAEGTYNAGGGSGGSIYLITGNLTGNGTISSIGGDDDGGGCCTGGGGGRIAIILTSSNDYNEFIGTIKTYGGNAGNTDGAAGTIYIEKVDEDYGELIIDNPDNRAICDGTSTLIWENVTGTTVGKVTIRNSGILEVNTSLMVYGDWNNTGTFDENISTINFFGDSSDNITIHNNESFYNLNITKKIGSVLFTTGSIINVTNEFIVQGNSSDDVYLRSTVDGEQWYLNLSGTGDVDYTDVMDSNASYGSQIYAEHSVDSGNNTNWVIGEDLTDCDNLTSEGATYYLSSNVSSSGTCINILANNITLDCQGYEINYSYSGTYGRGIDNSDGYNFTTIKNCVIKEGIGTTRYKYGIYFSGASNGTIENNTIINLGQYGYGIYLASSSNYNKVISNNLSESGKDGDNIVISSSNFNNVSSNTMISSVAQQTRGIKLTSSSNNTLDSNNITATEWNTRGIYFGTNSNSNTISNNNILTTLGGASYGIWFDSSNNNIIINNKINTSGGLAHGIYHASSQNNNFTNNNVTALAAYPYYIYGTTITDYNNTIGPDNLADGKPLNYTYNYENIVFDGISSTQYGQIIFAYCNNITIKNFNLTDNGISLYYTENSTVSNNNISITKSYGYGVSLYYSSDSNNVTDNTITTSGGYGYGIYLFTSSNYNNLLNNNITTSGGYGHGIYLRTSSDYNNITSNNISTSGGSGDSISLSSSNFNNLLSNTILTSTSQQKEGIYLLSSNNNTIDSNNITITEWNNRGVYISSSNSNYLSNNNILTTKGGGHGIYLYDDSLNTTVIGGNITTQAAGTYALIANVDVITATVTNTVLDATGAIDFYTSTDTDAGSWINFVNVTFNQSETSINDVLDLNVSYYLDVYVNDTLDNSKSGVNVTSWNNNSEKVFSVLTGTDGNIERQTLLSYTENSSGKTYYTPHSLNASKLGLNSYYNSSINLTSSIQMNLELVDPAPSVDFEDPTLANGSVTPNDNIYVNVSSSDVGDNVSTFIDFDNSLVAWWRMDDVNGSGDPTDYLGLNNGTAVGDAVLTSDGKIGDAFSFDGDDDWVEVGNDTHLTTFATLSGWIFLDSFPSNAALLSRGADWTAGYSIILSEGDSKIYTGYTGLTPQYGTSNAISEITGRWIHVVSTYNGTTISVYVDGVLNKNTPATGNISSNSGDLHIGRGNGAWSPNGSIDDVMIFNRSLSADEIVGLYANISSKYLDVNFTDLADGAHTFKAYAQDGAGNVNLTSQEITVDTTAPTITLNSPINHEVSYENITFNCSVTDVNELANITLYTNYSGSWIANESSSVSGLTNSTTFTLTGLEEKTFDWSCYACDNSSNCGFASSNQTYHLDQTAGTINFTSDMLSDGGFWNRSWFEVKFSVNETHEKNTTVNLYNSTGLFDSNYSLFNLSQYQVGYWSFDNDYQDYSDIGNDGTNYSDTYLDTGYYGNAAVFDGEGDYIVNSTATSGLPTGDSSRTITMWVNGESYGPLYSQGVCAYGEQHLGISTDSGLRLYISAYGHDLRTANSTSLNEWQFITVTYAGDGLNTANTKVYINGVEEGLGVAYGTEVNLSTAANWNIGGGVTGCGSYFNGSIDEVRIFNKALTQTEITNLYNLHKANFTNLEGGQTYKYNVTAYDLADNVFYSETRNFTTDFIAPWNITLYDPTPTNLTAGTYSVTLNWTVQDNLDTNLSCYSVVDDIEINRTYSVNASYTTQTLSMEGGMHNYYMRCYDDANNSNISEIRTYTVGLINFTTPEESELVRAGNFIEVNLSIVYGSDYVDNITLIVDDFNSTSELPISNLSSTEYESNYTVPILSPRYITLTAYGFNNAIGSAINVTSSRILLLVRPIGAGDTDNPQINSFNSNLSYLINGDNVLLSANFDLDTILQSENLTVKHPDGNYYRINSFENFTDNNGTNDYISSFNYTYASNVSGIYEFILTITDVEAQSLYSSLNVSSSEARTVNWSGSDVTNFTITDIKSGELIMNGSSIIGSLPQAALFNINLSMESEPKTIYLTYANITSENISEFLNYTLRRSVEISPPSEKRVVDIFDLEKDDNLNFSNYTIYYNYSDLEYSINDEDDLDVYKCSNASNCSLVLQSSTPNITTNILSSTMIGMSRFLIVEDAVTTNTVTVSSSGGGGTTTVYANLEIVTPGKATMELADQIIMPLTLRNPLDSSTLSNVKLNATPNTGDLSTEFDREEVDSIGVGKSEVVNMIINSHSFPGEYEIDLNVSVENPKIYQTAKIFIKLVEDLNSDFVSERIVLVEDLFRQNPQCLEFNDYLIEAEQTMEENPEQAKELVEYAIKECRDLITTKESLIKRVSSLVSQGRWQIPVAVTSVLFALSMIGLMILFRMKKKQNNMKGISKSSKGFFSAFSFGKKKKAKTSKKKDIFS
ncbi:hypothetical protein HN832_00555, partial [archaeon]|nr:hypothetical protein [archaeon]